MKGFRMQLQRKHRAWGIFALAAIGVLALSLTLAARPMIAEAKGTGPNSVIIQKDKTKTPEPTETETRTRTPEPTETVEPTETPQGTETPRPGSIGARFEFKGLVEARPSGNVGVWRIAGQEVVVDAATRFNERKGPAAVGTQVEVKGFRTADGRLLASRIKVDDDAGQPGSTPQPGSTTLIKWRGVIEAMPAGGLQGVWQVAGRTFTVTAATQLKNPAGSYALGVFVKVHGLQTADGSIAAHEVELEFEND